MKELSSKTQLGGVKGDTHGNEEIGHVYIDGSYSWVKKIAWDRQIVEELPVDPRPKTIYSLIESTGVSDVICREDGSITSQVEYVDIGGRFLLDPNEINGWGVSGYQDNANTQDLGNSDATSWSRASGGFGRPYDIELLHMSAKHYNNHATAQAWGWAIAYQEKAGGANTSPTTVVFNETVDNGGANIRNYLSTDNQKTEIDISILSNRIVPAENTIILGAAAPTAVGTNYYTQIMDGRIAIRRHFS